MASPKIPKETKAKNSTNGPIEIDLLTGALHADFVFVSDVHMKDQQDRRAQKLVRFMDCCARGNVKTFVLGGDICEFFWARTKYFQRKFDFLRVALQKLVKPHSRVYFIQGNHEYCLSQLNWGGVETLDADGATLELEFESGSAEQVENTLDQGDSEQSLGEPNQNIPTPVRNKLTLGLSHGDLMGAPYSYHLFRRVVASKLFKTFLSLIPQSKLDDFALWFASQSRKKDKYRVLDHGWLLDNAEKTATSRHEDVHVFGHFHFPYQAVTDSGTKLLCVNSWVKPNALLFSRGKWFRAFVDEHKISLEPLVFKDVDDYLKA